MIMPKTYLKAYSEAWQAFYFGTIAVPIVLITIMYLALLFILKKNSGDDSKKVSDKKKALTRMTTGITIATLICYTPFIIWTQFLMIMIKNNVAYDVSNTLGGVS